MTIVSALLLVAFCWLFWLHERDLFDEAAGLLRHAQVGWLALGLLSIPLSMALPAVVYRLVLAAAGARPPLFVVVQAYLRSLVAGTVIPFGPLASNVVLVRELVRGGVQPEAAVVTSVLVNILNYGAFMLLLIPAVILIALDSEATGTLVLASALLVLLLVLLVLLLRLLLRAPSRSSWLRQRFPGRILAFLDRLQQLAIAPPLLVAAFAVDIVSNLVVVLMLYLSLRALGQHSTAAEAFGGVALAMVLGMVAPVFQGAGAVELTMAEALERLGVPGGAALGGALLFRLFSLWLPLLAAAAFVAVYPVVSRLRRGRPPRAVLGRRREAE